MILDSHDHHHIRQHTSCHVTIASVSQRPPQLPWQHQQGRHHHINIPRQQQGWRRVWRVPSPGKLFFPSFSTDYYLRIDYTYELRTSPRWVLLTPTRTRKSNVFADLSDTEQEVILDRNVQIVNLEANEQPEAFYLTPDEDSDEADGAFVDKYLTTQSPVKP